MVNSWFVTCILATWAVNSSRHQLISAPEPAETTVAPTPAAVDCSSLIYNMADCLPFLSDGSDETTPDCCSGFNLVMNTDADCICEALKSSSNLGVELNMTKATTLPSACGISAPSLSSCYMSMAPSSPPGAPPVNPPPNSVPPPDSQNPPPSAPPPEAQNPPPASAPPPEAQIPPLASALPPDSQNPPLSTPPPTAQDPPPASAPAPETQDPPPATPTSPEAQNPPPTTPTPPEAQNPPEEEPPAASNITSGGSKSPAPSPASSGSSYTIPISFPLLFNVVVASLLYI